MTSTIFVHEKEMSIFVHCKNVPVILDVEKNFLHKKSRVYTNPNYIEVNR